MDEMNEDPSEISSFHVNKVIHASIVDLNKKRKSLDEVLGLPPAKHKFGERSSGSANSDDSEIDSNSSVGESNSSSSQSTEATKYHTEFPKAFAYDQPPTFGLQFQNVCGGSQASSSSSQSPTSFKGIVYSDDSSISIEEETSDKEEESLLFKHQKFLGKYANNICADNETDEIEFLDIESEEIMLCSNAATSDPFVLSSGRWNINKDADSRPGVKKPTIDQEFEQYFSMLML